MKKVFLSHLIVLTLLTSTFSQNTNEELQKNPTCFFVSHAVPKSNKKQISKTYCIGDPIKVALKENQMVKGTLDHISRENMITVDGIEMDVNTIESFQKPGLSSGAAVAGGILIAGGAALILNGTNPNTEFDDAPAFQVLAGIISAIGGIVVLTNHSGFEIEEGDIWIYNH